jgi:TetR/AcrR family transcriptional repressor of mexJK operon
MSVEVTCSMQDTRDRRERRRDAVIAAARQLFLERGFEAVSLNEIVRHSGGSLSTVYKLFENKAGLLHAVIRSEQFDNLGRIVAIAEAAASPKETLLAIAREIYDQFLDAGKVALLRIVIAESLRDPSFAYEVFREVHLPFTEVIEALFARWQSQGQAAIHDPGRAARFFIGAVLHPPQTRAMCGHPLQFSPDQRDRAAAEVAELFVRGYAIEPHR